MVGSSIENLLYSVQTCTLLTTNRPSTIGELYRFAIKAGAGEHTKEHGINIAALMRESALKSTIFVGVPRVDNFVGCSK